MTALASASSSQVPDTLIAARLPTPAAPRPRYRSVAYGLILIAGDCLAVFVVVMSVWWASAKFWPKHEALLAAGDASSWRDFMILLAAIFVYIAVKGRYHEPIPFWVQTRVLTCACFCAIGVEMISRLLRNEEPPLNVIIALLALPVLATAIDCISKQNLKSAGLWALPVVLISDRPSEAEAAFAGHDYRFVGHASPGEVLAGSAPNRIRSVIDRYSARLVLIVTDGKLQRQVIACALSEGVPFVLVPAWPVPAFPFKLICIFGQDTLLLSFQGGVSRPSLIPSFLYNYFNGLCL